MPRNQPQVDFVVLDLRAPALRPDCEAADFGREAARVGEPLVDESREVAGDVARVEARPAGAFRAEAGFAAPLPFDAPADVDARVLVAAPLPRLEAGPARPVPEA